jgi:hypothetical protein
VREHVLPTKKIVVAKKEHGCTGADDKDSSSYSLKPFRIIWPGPFIAAGALHAKVWLV